MPSRAITLDRLYNRIKPLDSYQRLLRNREQYKIWRALKEQFPHKPPTFLQIMAFCYKLGGAKYYAQKSRTARYMSEEDYFVVKPPYANTQINTYPDMKEHISNLRRYATSYTVYSFMSAFSAMRKFKTVTQKYLFNMKIKDYDPNNFGGQSLPEWLKIIIDRQYQLAINAGLGDDDPLFFVMRKNKMLSENYIYLGKFNRTDLVETEELIEYHCDYNIFDWVSNSLIFYGMPKGALMLTNVYASPYVNIRNKYVKHAYRTAGIYTYNKRGERSTYGMCSVYGYIEMGVFMAETAEHGPIRVPFYLMAKPYLSLTLSGSRRYREQIVNMGHISKEELSTMRNTRQLTDRKIKTRKF